MILGIFLVNRSDTTIESYLENDRSIAFIKEVRNIDGNWKEIDAKPKPLIYCSVGNSLVYLKLPSNRFTWQKMYKKKYQGDYKTEMRFFYLLSDSTQIVSKTVKRTFKEP